MTPPSTIMEAPGRVIGRVVEVYDELDSTNRLATERTGPGCHGLAIVARHQTAGRGQYGRTWLSRPDSSLLVSVCLHPEPWHSPVVLTAWAALGVARVVEEFGAVRPRLKWPNDVYVGGKKVCGILSERGRNVVVGIGLNLRQTRDEFDLAGLPDATSLALISGSATSNPTDVLERLLDYLDEIYGDLEPGPSGSPNRSAIEADWVGLLDLIDRPVRLEEMRGECRTGLVRNLSFEGVRIETLSGATTLLNPHEIRRISEDQAADGTTDIHGNSVR